MECAHTFGGFDENGNWHCICELEKEKNGMKPYVLLWKEGDHMGVETNIQKPEDFKREFASALADIVERNAFPNDWEFQLNYWLDYAFAILLKLSGYKEDSVEMQSIARAGNGLSYEKNHIVIRTDEK